MNILIIEILACLIATAFLSLFIGWVLRGSITQKQIQSVDAAWETKLSELQLRHKQDTEHLEDQVDRLDSESNQLAQRNDTINASLRENELSVHKARADAIELNRKQANTQERLQRIIAQKDEELRMFREKAAKTGGAKTQNRTAKTSRTQSDNVQTNKTRSVDTQAVDARSGKVQNNKTRTAAASTAVGMAAQDTPSAESTEAKIASLSAKRVAWEAERQRLIKTMGDEQETIAIDPADLPTEPLDKTVQINQEQAVNLKKRQSRQRQSSREPNDVETDKTQMIDDDQTMVLDDHNINGDKPQRPTKRPRKPGNNDR